MSKPIFDNRDRESLMALISRRAGEYTPEWHYDRSRDDPGAALAEIFGDMFYQTIDRFNGVSRKAYTEFLNLLGVSYPEITSASGYVKFEANAMASGAVTVPAGTSVFAPGEENGENIIYETTRRIDVSRSLLTDVFYSDTANGVIQHIDISGETDFFTCVNGENLQRHRFLVSCADVLSYAGECVIEVEIRQSARFLEEATAKRLGDSDFARWSFFDGNEDVDFDSVSVRGSTIVLKKSNGKRLSAGENGKICICCTMQATDGEIVLDGLTIKCNPVDRVRADSLSNNDIPISQADGGYCFGRRPAPYELFYIRSDDVFGKKGAEINVRMDISSIIHSDVDRSPQYSFNKRLIDKKDAVVITPDDVFVEQVVWEYYNGTGWASLDVKGNRNPFSGKDTESLELTFTAPKDTASVDVNAETGYYIRARVVNVENFSSMYQRWIIPFVKSVECIWSYSEGLAADYVYADNNGKSVAIEDCANISDLGFVAYSNLEPHPRAMYLRFDSSPDAMPLSLLFELCGQADVGCKILYEQWNGTRFEPVRVIDKTKNLFQTGNVFLYLTEPLPEHEFFGITGCWLRMSLSSFTTHAERFPRIGKIELNTVVALQSNKADNELFSTDIYDSNKSIALLYAPVITCEVWVDEITEISQVELEAIQKSSPGETELELEDNIPVHFWVKWKRIPSLMLAEPDERVYELDSYSGIITLGTEDNGRVPPEGNLNIRVEYSYGGGSFGNISEGRINSLVRAITGISGVKNISPMCGGTDRPETDFVEDLGKCTVRHRNRAMGPTDFENMTAEKFPLAVGSKCFSNRDENGANSSGHVTVVVMGAYSRPPQAANELCDEIYQYLAARCDCNLVASGRLHVIASTEITVNISISVELIDLDCAAVTQQLLIDRLDSLINTEWRSRPIGAQYNINEIYSAAQEVPNIRLIRSIFVEGTYMKDGKLIVCPLEDESEYLYSTVKSGSHTVRLF